MKIRLAFILKFTLLPIFALNLYAQDYVSPVYEQKKINDIVIHENLRYGEIPENTNSSSSDRILDLYLPETLSKKDKLPVFLFIHGGGFSGGDKALTDFCTKIAQNGYAVASINYRLSLKNNKVSGASCGANMAKGLPQRGKFHPLLQKAVSNASEDAHTALQWLAKQSKKYQLDINQVVVCGGSAGAMTALHLAYMLKPKDVKLKAVVNFWGGLEDASLIPQNAVPLLTYHGDKDDIIHVDYAYALHKRMEELQSTSSKLNILPNKGHALYKYITENKINEIISFLKSL
ncbi:alpha/beta hydrolase [Pedobacter glucosidilyticus]|uniref:alpha/beta hydrolase n=1 Tax=Pedobacter glucosidilyticus TaxID=1122941 RepID=UPI0026F259E5|nr:alpha/beta hydrolase [Pedobacter glucosidilyticus]